MAKRFTDTEKWKKRWFRSLSPVEKCVWFYLLDNCNHAGIWDVDFEIMGTLIGVEATPEFVAAIREKFKKQYRAGTSDNGTEYWFIVDFIPFQYNCEIAELNPSSRVHKSVLQCLKRFDSVQKTTKKDTLSKPYPNFIQKCKDKDKDKDKDKEEKNINIYISSIEEFLGSDHFKKLSAYWQKSNVHKIDIAFHVEKARAWLVANAKKPKKDFPRFFNNWIMKEIQEAKEKPQVNGTNRKAFTGYE